MVDQAEQGGIDVRLNVRLYGFPQGESKQQWTARLVGVCTKHCIMEKLNRQAIRGLLNAFGTKAV